ncbi:MAG: efflux RND transporter permease subunit [Thermoguttaceae bacterium]
MISHFFIDRPIFACVVCLIITLLGAVSIPSLPIEQFPEIAPPTITVTAQYPGASAEDVVNAVAIPLEQQINGVDDMIYMSTSCTSDGSMTITISFEVGTNPDIASVLVQNRVKMAEPKLPEDVRRYGVAVEKRATNFICFMSLFQKHNEDAKNERDGKVNENEPKDATNSKQSSDVNTHGVGISGALAKAEAEHEAEKEAEKNDSNNSTNGSHADKDSAKSGQYLANYASLYLKDRLARVKGVGQVMMFDTRDFSMRIWLDEDAMAAREVSVQEVHQAIREQNMQVAAGRIGVSPVPEGIQTNLAIVTLGRLADVTQFENIILRVDNAGRSLRLKDIAVIELGAASYTMECRYAGQMATALGVSMRSGANALDVADRTLALMAEMKESINRSGLEYAITYNATDFIKATVLEFVETLVLCVLFVVLTVYIFLQDWRAALIPTLTIPVSIVGTFFLMSVFDFSINTMSLFGLILVIGIVVDDAIVVVENTQRIIDEEHLDGHSAAKKSMNEVIGPVIATVLVMMAVFLPTAMMQGIIGTLYKQFALTIAGAVAISGICGVVLAPALCAILLRPSIPANKKFIGFRIFNFFFDGFGWIYLKTVKTMIFFAPLILILWFVLVGGLVLAMKFLPSGFLPNEDQGVIFCELRLPEGASQERTAAVLDHIETIFEYEKTIRHNEKGEIISGGIKSGLFINGFSFMSGQASNLALCIIPLKPWKERKEKALKPQAIIERLKLKFNSVVEGEIQMFTPPPIMGLGMATGVSYELLDERDAGPYVLAQVMADLKNKATAPDGDGIPVGTIVFAITPFNPNAPRLYLDIDRDKAKRMGLSFNEVSAALQTNLATAYINDFNKFGRTFRVNAQAKGEYRASIENVLMMKVKNKQGTMVPLSAFVKMHEISGPQLLTRFNLFPSASFTGIVRGDKSTGQAMEKLKEVSKTLPDGFGFDWSGMSFQQNRVGNQMTTIFFLSIAFAFLILAAQYESWSTPLIIMMAVPLGVAGAISAVVLFAIFGGSLMEVNIYTQIGLLLIVGLSAKNAILITEFAKEKRDHGMPLVQAAYEAGRLRLRPIFMTSFAFILGVVPLVVANGAGANSRNAIGNCVFGGLFMETMVGVYVTPVLFVLIQGSAEMISKRINAALAHSREKAKRHAEIEEVNLRHGD